MRNYRRYLVYLFAGILLALFFGGMFAGCGTRKANSKVENVENKNIQDDSSKGQVTKDSGNSENSGNSVANNVVNENQQSRIAELFNENGTLKSRISELSFVKSTDKTTSNNYIVKTAYSHTDSVFNNTHYIDRTITIHTKEKATTTNRNGLYMLGAFGLLILGVLAWFKIPARQAKASNY